MMAFAFRVPAPPGVIANPLGTFYYRTLDYGLSEDIGSLPAMPALPAVSRVIRCVMQGSSGSDVDVINRWYIQYSGTAPVNSDLVTFATAINTAWNANLKSLHPNSYSKLLFSCTDLSSATGAFGELVSTTAGTRGAAEVPVGNCFVVSFELARRYRGGHPRIYMTWGVEGDLASANTWNSTLIGNAQTGWSAFMTAILAAGWSGAGTLSHVNVSYYKGFTVITNPVTGRARNLPTLRATPQVDPVTNYVYRAYVGSQRRRNEARP